MFRYLSLPQMLPVAATSAPVTRLISMEELTSSVIGRQNAEDDRPRLLRVDPPSESTNGASSLPSSNSRKRQSHINFHVIDFLCLKLIILLTITTVWFIGRRGERRRRGGQEKQRSHSDRLSLSSLYKR